MNHLYIRHAVGGMPLFDSKKDQCHFKIEKKNDNTLFLIGISDEFIINRLKLHSKDMNIFLVNEEHPELKSWYYSSEGLVEYNHNKKLFIITADRQMDYNV